MEDCFFELLVEEAAAFPSSARLKRGGVEKKRKFLIRAWPLDTHTTGTQKLFLLLWPKECNKATIRGEGKEGRTTREQQGYYENQYIMQDEFLP